ncbi:hypothetical protein HBN50_08140 [Halobacteriovorax sp. GB3]|uniref:hypothetical protein n=1 Tax=Halobacteriovorax sp. GB3 TaxID=2719615 RepID=UPI002361AD86|nr:hypothetical protein [Halobacteriovorax sp. GB3]MDD0853062.1 hypothetical protein [Halobacteriovorax sp. GB3]
MKNPLYVVTNNGKDVEQVANFFEVIVKKLGLGPIIDIFNELLKSLFEQVNSYAMLLVIQEFIDNLVAKITKLFPSLA